MESRGLLRGAILLAALSLVRLLLPGSPGPDPAPAEGDDHLPELLAEAEAARDDQLRRGEPLKAGETLDPNRSSELELDRLPGVGIQVAEAIIRTRSEKGGFRRAEDLLEVPGIGPATLARIRHHLDFSRGVPLELPVRRQGRDRLDLNRASVEELQGLPGIGPALAARILESRSRDGPFEEAEDLLRVPGIGPAKLARLRPLVRLAR